MKFLTKITAALALAASLILVISCTNLDDSAVEKAVPIAPAAPSIAADDGILALTWTGVADAEVYEVWYGTIEDSSTSIRQGEDIADTSYTLKLLTNGTTYYVWLKAKNSSGTSGFGTVASGTPVIPYSAPEAPGAATVTAGDGQLLLSWTAVTGVNGATAYEVWYRSTGDLTPVQSGGDIAGTSHIITGLDNGTQYYVWLRAKNSAGTSGFGTAANGTTMTVINIASITGVTPPAYNGTPVTSITDTDQYTGTVTWSGSPETFAVSTVYTATITLTAKTGFTLTGVAENFFTVAGAATVSNAAGNGIITAVFPATPAVYSVTYNVGTGNTSGTIPVDGTVYISGATVTVLGDTGTLKGELIYGTTCKAFLGWDTDASATVAQYKAGSTFTITANTTLYAIYTALRVTGPGGGLIFYDAGSTQSWGRYLEAAPTDQSSGIQWYNGSYTATGATATAIGTGFANSNTIRTSQGPTYTNYAAGLARACTAGGFTDWYLPSSAELLQMCWNLKGLEYVSDIVQNPDVPVGGVGGFADESYWSSSETRDDCAYLVIFANGILYNSSFFDNPDDHGNKGLTLRVRAVRAF